MRRWKVRFSRQALRDFVRLADLLAERAPEVAEEIEPTLREAVRLLARLPLMGRPVEHDPTLRELLVPFGRHGYVVLYRVNQRTVDVLAARHMVEHAFR